MKIKRLFAILTAVCLLFGVFAGNITAIAQDMPVGIEITTLPNITKYLEGDHLNVKGMIVELIYANTDNNRELDLSEYAFSADVDNLMPGVKYYVIYQTGSLVGELKAELEIEVEPKSPEKITILLNEQAKTEYTEGNTFDKTGMSLLVEYNNGTSATITDVSKFSASPATLSLTGTGASSTNPVTVSYTENGVTRTAVRNFTVLRRVLTNISIISQPTNRAYVEGDSFNRAGMVVRAHYNNNTWANVTNFSVNLSTLAFSHNNSSATITFSEHGVTRTAATQAITVARKVPTDMVIAARPTKTAYIEGERFNRAGLVVRVSFNGRANVPITNYQITPDRALLPTDTAITISYTENGVTQRRTTPITVRARPTSISFNTKTATLGVGETRNTAVTILPSGAVPERKYTSSNTRIATVDSNGRITAVAPGTATITVTTNHANRTDRFTVTVLPAMTKIAYKTKSATIGVGETFATAVTITPSNAKTNRTYSSSNTKIATVDSKGRIKGVKAGTATITVTSYNNRRATFNVTIRKAPARVTLNRTTATLARGKKLTLTTTLPNNTASNKMTWSSSNKKVATVNSKGRVTAVARGTAVITVRTYNGKTHTCRITVT